MLVNTEYNSARGVKWHASGNLKPKTYRMVCFTRMCWLVCWRIEWSFYWFKTVPVWGLAHSTVVVEDFFSVDWIAIMGDYSQGLKVQQMAQLRQTEALSVEREKEITEVGVNCEVEDWKQSWEYPGWNSWQFERLYVLVVWCQACLSSEVQDTFAKSVQKLLVHMCNLNSSLLVK